MNKTERKEAREYYQKHKERIQTYNREWMRKHRVNNREKYNKYQREYMKKRKDKDPQFIEYLRTGQREWGKKNIEYRRATKNKYMKNKRRSNPILRIDENMGKRIAEVLNGKKAGRKWESLVKYTIEDLIKHLEQQFDENMSWNNYGSYWWIDHIKPRSLFHYETDRDIEFKECWALNNLQPLEKIANIKKSNHYE